MRTNVMCINRRYSFIRYLLFFLELLIYLCVIVYITCISREISIEQNIAPYPFWSFVKVINGSWEVGMQIIENVILFVPLGCIISFLNMSRRRVALYGGMVSLCVEFIQLIYHLGLFEFDDVITNTIGTFIGALLISIIPLSEKIKQAYLCFFCMCSVLYCASINSPSTRDFTKDFYFEIDQIVTN